jgi:uncharacterized protein (DUF2235 family)
MDRNPEVEPKQAHRNIVICCDGTGNEISENISNVLKPYRCLSQDGQDARRPRVNGSLTNAT